jgi:ATP-dependent helicase/nuclease subunit B
LWITGLHDEALPPAASPNPFLPLALQREFGLPHSSPERELAFAARLMERLLHSAPDVVLSYPETEGDRTLAPSPVVAGPWPAPNFRASTALKLNPPPMQELDDHIAPQVAIDSRQPGGASLFKDMAECPFRAFGKHRLGARKLEDAGLGPSYKDRGTGVHKAMEVLWSELGSHQRLMQTPPDDLSALIRHSVNVAIQKLGPRIGSELERRRLEKVVAEWIEIEKARTPFVVLKPEEEKLVALGGLQVRTRADRIDEIADGRQIILDYKTGQVKSAGWNGDRPNEPQLPLYCATSDRPIAGAAFVLIRVGELTFRGATEGGVTLLPMKKMSIEPPLPLAAQIVEWRRVLERLAENYRDGHAEVDPKPDACDYCGLRALCRIRESANDRG